MDDSVAAAAIGGVDIAKIMTSSGPIVNAVILRYPPLSKETEEDSKPAALPTAATTTTEKKNGNDDTSSSDTATVAATATAIRPKRVVITDLIEEVKIDTTPSKSKIAEVLGGPFTFLGQYEDEGIVLMVRKLPDDLEIVLEDIYNNEEEGEEEEVDDDDENNNKTSSNKSTPNKPSFSFPEQLSKNFNVKALKAVCIQREIVTEGMIEKSDLIKAILDYQSHLPPYNTHQLQPPLHKACVRGDILILKVAETKEELDGDSDEEENNNDASKVGKDIDEGSETGKNNVDDNKNQNNEKTITKVSKIKINNEVEAKPKEVKTDELNKDKDEDEDKYDDETKTKTVIVPTNDEFFLDYSKSEYVTFASRTDIPEHEIETPEDDDKEEDENAAAAAAAVAVAVVADTDEVDEGGDGNGEAFIIEEDGDDEEIDETDKSAMFNLVMNEVLRQYREENGRGPNTKELLELRANIAKELGVEIAKEIDGDWDKKANADSVPSAKKIAFDPKKDTVKEYVPDANEYLSDNGKDIISRSLMGDYDEDEDEDDEDEDEDDEDDAEEPPTKRLKTSEKDEK